MSEIYYKIGEVSEMLGIEQHTLRYLEHSLKLKIKRDERGDRQYTENDLEILKLVLRLKNEKGLNTTAIKMALENMEQPQDDKPAAVNQMNLHPAVIEMATLAKTIVEQNEELFRQNNRLVQRIDELEKALEKRDREKNNKIDELINLWKAEQERNKSWFSRFRGK
jgi:DNA-binding transcriptional MerR regulator